MSRGINQYKVGRWGGFQRLEDMSLVVRLSERSLRDNEPLDVSDGCFLSLEPLDHLPPKYLELGLPAKEHKLVWVGSVGEPEFT